MHTAFLLLFFNARSNLARGRGSSPKSGQLQNALLVAVGFLRKGCFPSKRHSQPFLQRLSPSSSLHPCTQSGVLIAGLEDHKTLNT